MRNMRKSNYLGVLWCLGGLLVVGAVAGAEEEAALDAYTVALIEQASAYLAQLPTFGFVAEVYDEETLSTGERVHVGATIEAAVRRDNGFWVKRHDDDRTVEIWFNGTSGTVLNTPEYAYATAQVGPTIDDALDGLYEKHGTDPPLSDFLRGDPKLSLLDGARLAFYEGIQVVDGTPCHHVHLIGEDLDWQIWIDSGIHPVPRRYVINYKNESGSPQFVATIKDWHFHHVPDTRFEPLIPAGSDQIEFLAKTWQ